MKPLTRVLAGFLAALVVAASAAPARAEHEVFYRYTLVGFVKDARGKPVAGRTIEVIRDKTGFSYLAESDAQGFFVVVVRLGDESAGERLTLKAGAVRAGVVARFDPANHADERGTRVDVEGGRVVERAAWFRSTLARLVGPPQR